MAGATAVTAHIVGRSAITAGPDPATFAKESLWVPIAAALRLVNGGVGTLVQSFGSEIAVGLPARQPIESVM